MKALVQRFPDAAIKEIDGKIANPSLLVGEEGGDEGELEPDQDALDVKQLLMLAEEDSASDDERSDELIARDASSSDSHE